MAAYAHYENRDYDEIDQRGAPLRDAASEQPGRRLCAIPDRLVVFRPDPDISRDQDRTEKAVAALEEIVRKFPNTEYAVSARKKIEIARDQLAGKEMLVGRYYIERRNYTGAINRFKVVVTHYQTTRHVEEALMRLTEAYMSLGMAEEAQTAAAVLGHNFPDSPWYKDAYALVKGGGLEPHENTRLLDQPGVQQARPGLTLRRQRRNLAGNPPMLSCSRSRGIQSLCVRAILAQLTLGPEAPCLPGFRSATSS